MKHKRLSAMLGVALATAVASPAYAVLPVYDFANHTANAVTGVATTLTALKMHAVKKSLRDIESSLQNMGGNNAGYYDEIKTHWGDTLYHNEVNTTYLEENNFFCNTGGGEQGSGAVANSGSGASGGQICGTPSGDIDVGIPIYVGVGQFGGTDATAYMDASRESLDGVGGNDLDRLTNVMDGNRTQANAIDAQTSRFDAQGEHLQQLARMSTQNMGSRMQAAYSNQLAAAQTSEMMQMRALMLADQNAQVVRAQESAAFDARQSRVEASLRDTSNVMLGDGSTW